MLRDHEAYERLKWEELERWHKDHPYVFEEAVEALLADSNEIGI